jgi:hypothetical protein
LLNDARLRAQILCLGSRRVLHHAGDTLLAPPGRLIHLAGSERLAVSGIESEIELSIFCLFQRKVRLNSGIFLHRLDAPFCGRFCLVAFAGENDLVILGFEADKPETSIATDPTNVKQLNRINALLASAGELYKQSGVTAKKLLYERVELGSVLIRLKDEVGHGNFLTTFEQWTKEGKVPFSLKIGQRAMAYMIGNIDELYVHSRALLAKEVASLAAEGQGPAIEPNVVLGPWGKVGSDDLWISNHGSVYRPVPTLRVSHGTCLGSHRYSRSCRKNLLFPAERLSRDTDPSITSPQCRDTAVLDLPRPVALGEECGCDRRRNCGAAGANHEVPGRFGRDAIAGGFESRGGRIRIGVQRASDGSQALPQFGGPLREGLQAWGAPAPGGKVFEMGEDGGKGFASFGSALESDEDLGLMKAP